MPKPQSLLNRWNRRTTILSGHSSLRAPTRPPSLDDNDGSLWQRLVGWMLAPAPQQAALPPNRLPRVRNDFAAAIADIDTVPADELRLRLDDARSLRELWHARSAVYSLVAITHNQAEAEERVALLNRHFPTRAPRSQFAPL